MTEKIDSINIFQDLKNPYIFNPSPNSLAKIRSFYRRKFKPCEVELVPHNGRNYVLDVFVRKL